MDYLDDTLSGADVLQKWRRHCVGSLASSGSNKASQGETSSSTMSSVSIYALPARYSIASLSSSYIIIVHKGQFISEIVSTYVLADVAVLYPVQPCVRTLLVMTVGDHSSFLRLVR